MVLLPVGFDQPVTQPLSFTEMAQLELPPRVPRSVMVYVVAEAIPAPASSADTKHHKAR